MTTSEQNRLQRLVARIRNLGTFNQTYEDVMDQQRSDALAIITAALLILVPLLFVLLLLFIPSGFTPISFVVTGILMLVSIVARILAARGFTQIASFVLILGGEIALVLQFSVTGFQAETALAFVIPIVLATILLDTPFVIATTALSMAAIFGIMLPGFPEEVAVFGEEVVPFSEVLPSLIAVYVMMLIVAFVATTLTGRMQRVSRVTERVNRRLEAAAVVADVASTQPNVRDLLSVVVERIREAYDFYHAQVFLLDETRENARLIASTGRAGEALLSREHSLPVGSQSVIGRCTSGGEPIVVNDTELSATHRPNPLLPRTRAELALPLIVGNEIIGAIDVQSVEPNVFQPEDIRSLQVLAGQLAASVSQARLIDELQAAAQQNERLLQNAQDSLGQIEELNRRLIRTGWTEYIRDRSKQTGGIGYTLEGEHTAADTEWSAPMRQAYNGQQSVVLRDDQQSHIAAIPVRVRGAIVGVLEVERDANRPWTEDDLDMAETLVERLALAVENARLYEQANRLVTREQLVSRIGQNVQGAGSVDEVLRTALAELSDVLGARRGAVQITPEKVRGE